MKNVLSLLVILVIISCQNNYRDSDSKTEESNLSNNDSIKQTAPSLQELEVFKKYCDSIGINNTLEYADYFITFCKIFDKYGKSKNMFINRYVKEYQTELDNGSASLESLLYIEEYVKDSIHLKEYQAFYYFKLIEQANYLGKMTLALKYDSLINNKFREFKTPTYTEKIQITRKVFNNIQQIKKMNLPKDRILWELGNNYCELFKYVGPTTEVSQTDMTYPFTFYDSLISLYPKSTYADNAIFIELDYLVSGSQEGGNNSGNLSCAEKYVELLSNYPNTEYKPQIYDRLCCLYSDVQSSTAEKSKYFELSKNYGMKLINEFPNYKDINKIKNILKEIENKK